MNVSSMHFRQTEDFFLDYISNAFKLNLLPGVYGFLPSSGLVAEEMIRITGKADESVVIEVLFCQAITSSGILFDFNAKTDGYRLNAVLNNTSKENNYHKKLQFWNIILTSEPFNRTPSGQLDPMETPPRQPDTDFSYSLTVVPTDGSAIEIKGHSLVIGRIRKNSHHYEIDHNYIPACITMSGNEALNSYYHQFSDLLQSLIRSSKAIISKIQNSPRDQILADNINLVCKEILRYCSGIYFDFRNNGLKESPLKTVIHFSSLAHTIYVSLSFFKESDKEELLKYFYEWSDVTPGSFEEILTNMVDLKYDHENLRTVMLQVEGFLRVFTELWGKLNQLEFIGKHKENIVVSERIQMAGKESKTGYTFLD
ncbi:type VI secretion system membrane-associated complex protein TssK [Marinilabilia salmonicolor]|uniref:type VI secretion system membrane-associated complex protein TssK n=1 Tax=Marinilabilia salmonicolor TaxID=989 RepID=UPI0011E03A6E|nr:type VI secretion system membrane-associated complex protein TssK [Marinilabilia salmonicolor]